MTPTRRRLLNLTRAKVPQPPERVIVRDVRASERRKARKINKGVRDDRASTPPQPERKHIANRPATAEEVLESLIQSRAISAPFDRLLALRIVNAAISGKLSDVKLLDHLPPPIRADVSSPVVTASAAKAKLLELVLNAQAADKVEAEQVEQSEVTALRVEVAELRRRLGEPCGREPRALVMSSGDTKVLTPPLGDIVPPREQTDNPANMRGPKYDLPKPPVVIDAKPEPAPSPTVPGQWDASDHGRMWREYRALHGDDYLL